MLDSSRRGSLAPNLVDRRLEETPEAACKGFGVLVKFPRLVGVRERGEKRGREGGWRPREGRGSKGGLGGGLRWPENGQGMVVLSAREERRG